MNGRKIQGIEITGKTSVYASPVMKIICYLIRNMLYYSAAAQHIAVFVKDRRLSRRCCAYRLIKGAKDPAVRLLL